MVPFTSSPTIVRDIRHAHLFCGIGGGAIGFQKARVRVGPMQGRFVCAGGIDVDPGAIRNFERITGTPGTVLDLFDREQYRAFHGAEPPSDWREAAPADIRRIFGENVDVLFQSSPCKGFSGLLSAKQSKTDKYQALNRLALRGVWLTLEAYQDDPIPIILFENVPRILNRGRWLLDQITALFRCYGYSVNIDIHDCGIIGNLAQSRKRALLIARHTKKIPPFVYQPRHHRLRGVGEVIGKLPLPGDPIAGPMHRIPALQWKTWLRLALVPAGKDWRALNDLAVVDGQLRDFGIVPEVQLRDNALGVNAWTDSAPVITGQRAPGQGRFAVADPRPGEAWHNEALGVRTWADNSRVVAGASRPHNGAHSVADPRPGYGAGTHQNILAVADFVRPAKAVTGARHPAGGALSVADPRPNYGPATHRHVLGVNTWSGEPTGTVTGDPKPSTGAFSVADPRVNGHARSVQLGVRPWDKPAACVKGDVSVGTGPYAVSDPRLTGDRPRYNNVFRIVPFDTPSPAVAGPGGAAGGIAVADPRGATSETYSSRKYKVTPFSESSRAVIGASSTGEGAFAVADPRPSWGNQRHRNILRVTPYSDPSGTIAGGHSVTGGQPCVADERREHYQTGGHYGVVDWKQSSYSVSGSACHDNGFNSVADPRPTDIEAERFELPAANDRLVCRIIATDGTWHRPFTTLDLAALQALFDPEEIFTAVEGEQGIEWHCREAFDLIDGSDVTKREWIGNMVPGAAATGMAETIGETILLAEQGETFFLSTREIWVKPGAMALAIDNDQSAFRLDALG